MWGDAARALHAAGPVAPRHRGQAPDSKSRDRGGALALADLDDYGPSPQAGFRAGWGDATCRPERITVVWFGQPRRNGVRAARNLQPGSATATAPCVWDGHPRLRRELLRSPGRT